MQFNSRIQDHNLNVAFKACCRNFYLSLHAGRRLSLFISRPEFECRIQGVPPSLLSKPTCSPTPLALSFKFHKQVDAAVTKFRMQMQV
jgi:hypothetical protein